MDDAEGGPTRRKVGGAFERARIQSGLPKSPPVFEKLTRMQEQLAAFSPRIERPDALDRPRLAMDPQPQLLRELVALSEQQTEVLQALVDTQIAADAEATIRADKAHRTGRAGVVAGLEAAVLAVVFGTGQHGDLHPLALAGTCAGVVAVALAAWVDWRCLAGRLRRR